MAIQGNIDRAADGHILGWVWDDSRPDHTLHVIAKANDKIIASAPASIFRQDLMNAGIGGGAHGFDLQVPELTVNSNEIHIMEEESGASLPGSPLGSDRPQNDPALPRLVVDVTDLLLFLDKNRKLTGIPRVQVEILRAIFRHALYDMGRLELVALSYATRRFETVNKNDLLAFIDRLLGEGIGIKQDGQGFAHIERHIRFRPFNPDSQYCGEGVFLSLGSAWGIPDFFCQVNQFLEKGMRLVILFHDIIPLVRPDLAPGELGDIFSIFVRSAFIFCDSLLTVSRHCANDIAEFARSRGYTCPPISVIGNGTPTNLPVHARPWLDDPYVLAVGTIENRKNHIVLAKAWQKLLARHGEKMPKLIFAGSAGQNIRPLLDFLKETDCLSGKIQIMEHVSDAKLASLYKGCLFTAYPSLYEGWGLPVTESLAFGKTCLCSCASSLPEAGLDYCVYFDPENVDDAETCAEKLIFDADFRKNLEKRIAGKYAPPQWRDVAAALIERVKQTGSRPHKEKTAVPAGMELAFWLPDADCQNGRNAFGNLAAFSKGRLADDHLGWDNYCLPASLIASGRFFPRTEAGWQGDAEGNTFSVKLDAGESLAGDCLYLLVDVVGQSQDIEFYSQGNRLQSLRVNAGSGLARLKLKDFKIGGRAEIFVKSAQNQPIIYKALLVLGSSDIERRLTLQEKMFNLRALADASNEVN